MRIARVVDTVVATQKNRKLEGAKLRWLLGKATAELGEVRLAELSPEQVFAWRLTFPEGTGSRRPRRCGRC